MRLIDADRIMRAGDIVLVSQIDNAPTVDAQPIIHAKWERGYSYPDGEYWKCSRCNELIKVKIPMFYCNNCGAKMDLKEAEDKDE